jgi:hypothetical protein
MIRWLSDGWIYSGFVNPGEILRLDWTGRYYIEGWRSLRSFGAGM